MPSTFAKEVHAKGLSWGIRSPALRVHVQMDVETFERENNQGGVLAR